MFFLIRVFFVVTIFSIGSVQAEPMLSLEQAEKLALDLDPASKRFKSQALSMQENAVAAGQLPDPKVRFGLMNFPTDTFARDQEPMTQLQLGVTQMFPRGDSLKIKSQKAKIMATSNEHQAENRQRMIIKKVRMKWLELYYWLRAEEVIEENREIFRQMVEVAQFHYSSGRRNQQDVIRAQLELSKLDDRLLDIHTQQDKLKAELGVLIDKPVEWVKLVPDLPELGLDIDITQMTDNLHLHPNLLAARSIVENSQKDVSLAREAYKPGMMLGVTYGARNGENPAGIDRPDFLSVMVTLDVPLFKDKRQDRKLAASQHKLNASQSMFDQQYLDLKQDLEKTHAELKRVQQRWQLYTSSLLPQAKQNSEASLFAYQNDRTDFSTLMRANMSELNTRLKSIRINVNRVKVQARLRYLAGEE